MKNNLILQLLKGDLFKMSNVQRYSGTKVIIPENLAQHSYYVSVLADLISEDLHFRFPELKIDKANVLRFALYHDYEEIYTGDIVTPVKYKDKDFREQLDSLGELLLKEGINENFEGNNHIGERIKKSHSDYESGKDEKIENQIVKFADLIQALGYVMQEVNMGNSYMQPVLKNIVKIIIDKYSSIKYFGTYIDNILDVFEK